MRRPKRRKAGEGRKGESAGGARNFMFVYLPVCVLLPCCGNEKGVGRAIPIVPWIPSRQRGGHDFHHAAR